MKFSDLNVESKIVEALSIYGLVEPTEIQIETIPLIQKGFDVVGQSKTGSGKTAAFAVPMLEKIDERVNKPQALVLSPTRELAQQIAEEFVKFSRDRHSRKSVNSRSLGNFGGMEQPKESLRRMSMGSVSLERRQLRGFRTACRWVRESRAA